jgi:hypothetical protein
VAKIGGKVGYWRLTPLILANQEAKKGLWFEASSGKLFMRYYLEKCPTPNRAGREAQVVK